MASQPSVIILQTPPPAVPVPERALSQALMIELRGGRYVQVSGDKRSGTDSGSQMIDPPPDSAPREERATIHPIPARELASAVLVFRDGHREEVSDYTVTDGVLYTRSDYYSNGYWNKKIELGSLNLPETINSNQSRGIRFQLPSAPNEVMVGP